MIQRFIPVGIVLFWLVSMGWLVHHDIIPRWTAQDAPRFQQGDWLTDRVRSSQVRIENAFGHRVGTAWTIYNPSADRLSRRDVLFLTRIPKLPPLLIVAESDFTVEGKLDEFSLDVFGVGRPVKLIGEQFGEQFAFQLKIGPLPRQYFKIDASVSAMLGDAFRPFSVLPNLKVGQSWRMHVLNPFAVVSGIGPKTSPMVVRVIGREKLSRDGGSVECFVVQADHVKAWVDDNGLVLRQEMESPWGGRYAVVDEAFDAAALDAALGMQFDGDQ